MSKDEDDDLSFGANRATAKGGTPVDRSESLMEQNIRLQEELRLLKEEKHQLKVQQAKNSNRDFVQLSRAEMRKISELSTGKSGKAALNLLMLFAQSMNKQNAVMISFNMLESITKQSRATIDRAIKRLKKDNWIQVIKVGNANVYVLNSSVFWTDKAEKRYATFSAQIITSFDEQDVDIRKNPDLKLRTVPAFFGEPELLGNGISLGNDELPPPDQQDADLV